MGRKTAARPRAGAARRRAATVAPAGDIGLINLHMDYTSHALAELKRFYGDMLGFPATEWEGDGEYLTVRTGPGSSLGFMPPMPGPPEQWRPPREPAIYLMVENVDGAYDLLTSRGLRFDQAPRDMFWGHRVAILRDPEGRTVCLAQIIKR